MVMIAVMVLLMLSNFGKPVDIITMEEFQKRVQNGDVKELEVYETVLEGEMYPEAMEGMEPDSNEFFKVEILSGVGEKEWLKQG